LIVSAVPSNRYKPYQQATTFHFQMTATFFITKRTTALLHTGAIVPWKKLFFAAAMHRSGMKSVLSFLTAINCL
jgi:hypothetical protein